jgi:hypothetical protein
MLAPTLLVHAALLTQLAPPYPFGVGETLQYEAKLGVFPVGTATASVSRLAQERGTPAMVLAMTGQGAIPGVRVRYDLTSWVATASFNSLRFHRRLEQGGKVEEEHYQIVPDSARYRQEGVAQDWVAPRDPLDELAFLYYLRTIPLQVGKTYSVSRYFQTGYNPIQVQVVDREPATLPNGQSVSCLSLAISSRGTTMGVCLTDDARRLPVRLDVPLPYGSVTLELSQFSPSVAQNRSGG